MASWFYAAEGKQQGPYQEGQFRDLIARGVVHGDTLVWTEGMAGWQKAAEIPGLMGSSGGPPIIPGAGGPPVTGAGGYAGGGAISADLPIWPLLGRTLLYVIGILLIIPAPWVATNFYRWFASRTQVPGRPNLAFNGQVADLWWVFVLLGVLSYSGAYDNRFQLVVMLIEAALAWMVLRWFVSNLSSNGQALPTRFDGSIWIYIGWQLLLALSFITIIGWAWVVTAWVRWICRNISGTRREIVFNASGLEVLWRTIVFAIGCGFLIPIPWVLRWYAGWYISQFALVERGAIAHT
jgi:uncharacterized protein DUF4339